LAVDSSNNLYIVDSFYCVVFKHSSGSSLTVVAGISGSCSYSGDNGSATSATLNNPYGVAVDSSGNLYIADDGNNVVRKVDASTTYISTVAGTGTAGDSGDSGSAISAKLKAPTGVAVDSSKNIYIADSGNNAVRMVDASTSYISTVAGTGTSGYSGNGSAATSATLNYPYSVALDSSGNLYIADQYNFVIREVSASTKDISTVAGNHYYSYSGDGGLAKAAQFNTLQGLVMDGSGNLYIADADNYVVRKVDVSTGDISTIAGNGTLGYSGDGGAATSAELESPHGLALDGADNLYIADASSAVVRKVDASTGYISTVAGNGTQGYSGDGGAATSAELSYPVSVAADSSGNLYIADTDAYVVRKVDVTTGDISTVAGNGTQGYSGDDNAATSAELKTPISVALDSSGNLYIADEDAHVVREVVLNTADTSNYGKITTVVGGVSTTSITSGASATDIALGNPVGVYVDYAGAIYVTDDYYKQVYKITGSSFSSPSSGTIAAVAGNGTAGYSGDDATATSAELDNPTFITGDIYGNLLIADSYYSVVRRVSGIVTPAPQSVLSATSLSFATQLLNNSASSTQTITVSNPGSHTLTVSSVAISGTNASDFTESDTCTSATVAAASTCTISVKFAATAAGSESATLTVTSNALASPQTISLSGAGITFAAPAATSSGSTSATVSAGSTATYALQIAATGGASTTDSLTISLTCSGAPTGATCTVPSSVTATPGTPATFTVSVATSSTTASAAHKSIPGNPASSFPRGMTLALIPFGAIGLGLARKRRKLMGFFLLALLAVVIPTVTGCGSKTSSSSSSGTSSSTSETYTLVIKATSGSVSQTTNLTLIVK
jgi:glucose/arabinose dehydrogenase